jgi:hypothetical protein
MCHTLYLDRHHGSRVSRQNIEVGGLFVCQRTTGTLVTNAVMEPIVIETFVDARTAVET